MSRQVPGKQAPTKQRPDKQVAGSTVSGSSFFGVEMSIVDYPTLTVNPSQVDTTIISNRRINVSPENGATQMLARLGTRVQMTFRYDRLESPDREVLWGFLAYLMADAGARISMIDPTWEPRGSYAFGSPTVVVDGGGQTGRVLSVRNAPANETNWLRAGDRISFFGGTGSPGIDVMKIVTADVSVNGAGDADIPISPELHFSPTDGTEIQLVESLIKGTFLVPNPEVVQRTLHPLHSTFSITFMEDIVGGLLAS